MRGSIRIFRFLGIDAFIHWTFLIIPALALWGGFASAGDAAGAIYSLALVLAIFACVLLHEYGHALAARSVGIKTRDITLLPLGGIARLERMPERPRDELWIAIAGPLVNVGIAALLALGAVDLWTVEPDLAPQPRQPSFLTSLFWANILLVAFNLLPAFPLDGGRVLRALLALWLGWVRATSLAATVGQVMATVLGFLALIWMHPFLFLIALFIFFAARAEASAVRTRFLFRGIRAREAMMTKFECLQEEATLGEAAARFLEGSQEVFPVLRGNGLTGLLTRQELLRGLSRGGSGERVRKVARKNLVIAEPDDMLESVLGKLQFQPAVPVVSHGELLGLLTADNVLELQMFRETTLSESDSSRGSMEATSP